MPITTNAILDRLGRVMFSCSDCGKPFTIDALFDLGLRLPDDGESRDEYFAAELIDSLSHLSCTRGTRVAEALCRLTPGPHSR